jgi:DNA-binding NarL/FixJ family response regulator
VGESRVTSSTKIVLIDDHQTFLDLLTLAVDDESDLQVVGQARTVSEGRRVIEQTRPDVVVLECVLPDGDGFAIVAGLIGRHPEIQVVVLTASEDPYLIARANAAGVAGLLTKLGSLTQIISTIRTARPGITIIDPLFLGGLQSAGGPAGKEPAGEAMPLPALTARELQVIQLLDQGKDIRTIARELSISLHTSRGYVKSLLAKLNCHSQLEAVVTARRLGVVAGPGWLSATG